MSTIPPLVVKLGGAQLVAPRLPDRLRNWLAERSAERPAQRIVLIVGGGPIVAGLREVDSANALSSEASHFAAIELMDVTGRLVSGWLPDAQVTDDFARLAAPGPVATLSIFLPNRFLRLQEPTMPGRALPVGWRVTSDSIAARIAALLSAELVLLKSREFMGDESWERAAENGYVDSYFPVAVREVRTARIAVLPKA